MQNHGGDAARAEVHGNVRCGVVSREQSLHNDHDNVQRELEENHDARENTMVGHPW